MKTVCELNKCAGCMACINVCPKDAIEIKDTLDAYNAVIDTDKCINCDACHNVCPNNNSVEFKSPIKWYQGWTTDEELRKKCSSGGLATAISLAFVKNGGYVYSCVFENGEFTFKRAKTAKEVMAFTGSKYVKSNPSGVYKHIRDDLREGKRVLFIGLPCQVAAVKNYVGNKFQENLYTIDLICHGTPSPRLLEIFLSQYDKQLKSFSNISFRVKAKMQMHVDSKGIVTKGVSDKYTIAFLNGLTYTENCYTCSYAQKKRISDITLGDSWGSELPFEEKRNGISLVLIQTEKGLEILGKSDLVLETVDINKAIQNNHQLEHPSEKPKQRISFFRGIRGNKEFNSLVFHTYPKQCIRQNVKEMLIKAKILRGGGLVL